MAALTGKAAVVTGGSRGIGRAVVLRLVRDGTAVVFNYAQSRDAANEVVRQAEAAGGKVVAVQLDLAETGAAEELLATAERQLGGLDILVNNAALHTEVVPIAETTEADFDRVMAVNAKAVFLTVRYAARHMRDGGRIVNFVLELSALARPIGGRAVHREQIAHILDVAQLRHVTLQVMPPHRETHSGLSGPFVLLETRERRRLAYLEVQDHRALTDQEPTVGNMFGKYGNMRAQALDPENSCAEIEKLAE
ncbi:SDR family NAD(P)-dependent oxidoreductase [Streptomyces sp. NPDC057644]|uniref:SDR family NAD(P)-dependent oxidoreductase n=1 Tax=Streptomyces sp. NPDC057644 TaxID=3346191 RepID=UPI0036A258A5